MTTFRKENRLKLLDILRGLVARADRPPITGICVYVTDKSEENIGVARLFDSLVMEWPEHSGRMSYPVPDYYDAERGQWTTFDNTYDRPDLRWSPDHPYGRARWRLVMFCIARLEDTFPPKPIPPLLRGRKHEDVARLLYILESIKPTYRSALGVCDYLAHSVTLLEDLNIFDMGRVRDLWDDIASTWPENHDLSGCSPKLPVPPALVAGEEIHFGNANENQMWDNMHPYSKARWRLIHFVIRRCKEMLDAPGL